MGNDGKNRPYRERRERETRETIPERVPKKYRGGSDTNADIDQLEDGVVSEAELLDPVAEARKALEMFEEVSGETVVHIIPKKGTTKKEEIGQKYVERSHNNSNGKIVNEKRRTHLAREKGNEEEKERQRKRIEDGEARRREFRPKIAGLQDSNCLL